MKLSSADKNAIDIGDYSYILNKGSKLYCDEKYEEAIEYYRLGASVGDTQAISNLGYCYMYGRGVSKNMDLAVAYFKMAAKYDVLDALYKLGELYLNGDGVDKDEETSLYYYTKAFDMLPENFENEYDATMAYPSLFYTQAKLLKDGKIVNKNIFESYRLLRLAIDGYTFQVEEIGVKFFDKVLKEAIKLEKDSIYDEAREAFKNEFEEEE